MRTSRHVKHDLRPGRDEENTGDYLNSAFHRKMNGPLMKFGRAVLGDFLVDIACDE
jgi:hypothetical protein